jgi:hypothetical protein
VCVKTFFLRLFERKKSHSTNKTKKGGMLMAQKNSGKNGAITSDPQQQQETDFSRPAITLD